MNTVSCFKCNAVFNIDRLIELGITGNEPLPFGQKLNRLFDGE